MLIITVIIIIAATPTNNFEAGPAIQTSFAHCRCSILRETNISTAGGISFGTDCAVEIHRQTEASRSGNWQCFCLITPSL
jgi:hypothetical protein